MRKIATIIVTGAGVAAMSLAAVGVASASETAEPVDAQLPGTVIVGPTISTTPKPGELYETYHVPASGAPLFQAAVANFNPFGGETKVNTENPDRGPVLIIAGENDNTAPSAITHATAQVPRQAQRGDHRDRRRARPWTLPDHRPRLAGGRRHRPWFRQAIQLKWFTLRVGHSS